MATKKEILIFLRDIKPEIQKAYKVKSIGLFGSVIRDEHKDTSDVDVLVDMDDSADLLDLIGLNQYLEEKLHCPVDVVPKGSLREEIRERVLQEVHYL